MTNYNSKDLKTVILEKDMEIEKLKAERDKERKANRLKSIFVANMSHDIRNPINAIVGFSELLAENDRLNREEKKQYRNIIKTNSDMVLRLIDDILVLSQMEAGIYEFKRENIDFASYFTNITESLKTVLNNPNVKFIVDNPFKTCLLTIDKDRISQILTNLVTNAIKYTSSGYIKTGYTIDNNVFTLYVEDTGTGIPHDKQKEIFEPFNKLGSYGQGSGLGLAIIKTICDQAGAAIEWQSEEGKGSSFKIRKNIPCTSFTK